MLRLDSVSRTFKGPNGTVHPLRDASFEVKSHDFVIVQGPSGTGKTTLLLIAGAMLKPLSGKVTIDEIDPYSLSPSKRSVLRSEKIGFIFQQFHLIPYLSVLDNIIIAANHNARKEKAFDKAHDLVRQFGIEARVHHKPSQLSTGEQQRTALARALINDPCLILADEPTGNLDQENTDQVFGHLAQIAENGTAVVAVTHDTTGTEYATKIMHLREGKIEITSRSKGIS